jgi:hypothetical protein
MSEQNVGDCALIVNETWKPSPGAVIPAPRKVPIGPPAPPDSRCGCGNRAEAQCQGCGGTFCPRCWYSHSHTSPYARDYQPFAAPAVAGGAQP